MGSAALGRSGSENRIPPATTSAILKEDPADLSITDESIPPALERLIRHCLEKNPEQRFHSAHDLAFDLEALSGISASTRATPLRAREPRRFRVLPASAALIALLAIVAAYELGRRRAPDAKSASVSFSQLTFLQEPIFNARFSPDGKTIIYKGELAVLIHPRYIRHSMFLGTLARMPLEGGAPRELAPQVREAEWSPDGSDLAIIRDANGKDRLEFPPGKVLAETGGYFSRPRFSRKGDRIAFFEHPIKFDDRGSVAIVDLAGKKTTLSDGYWGEEGLAWSPDDSEVMPFEPGTPHPLPDGSRAAVSTRVRRNGRLRDGTALPDGKKVLFCGHEAGRAVRCYVQDVNGGKPLAVTPDGTTDGIVSPDGRLILVSARSGGLQVFSAEGGAPRPVPGTTGDDAPLQWTSDGRSVFVANSEVPVRVTKIDVTTGRREPFATLGPPRPDRRSPDRSHRHQRRRQEPRLLEPADDVASVSGGRGALSSIR